MSLWEEPRCNKKASWNPWFCIKKLAIDEAGNDLFAASQFQAGETVGFCVGSVIHRHPTTWTEKATQDFLADRGADLKDDSRTMSLVDNEGFRALVNPHCGVDRKRTVNPSLFMGIHFLNNFHQSRADEALKEKTKKVNNVWGDDQGGVKEMRRIFVDEELFSPCDWKKLPDKEEKAKKAAKAKATATSTATGATGASTGAPGTTAAAAGTAR
jgi:hypothetical protein